MDELVNRLVRSEIESSDNPSSLYGCLLSATHGRHMCPVPLQLLGYGNSAAWLAHAAIHAIYIPGLGGSHGHSNTPKGQGGPSPHSTSPQTVLRIRCTIADEAARALPS